MKIISLFFAALLFSSSSFSANQPLQVVFNGCEPTEVISHDSSCGGGADAKNTACRDNNGPVRWSPLSSIREITQKAGSPGSLHNCNRHENQGYLQCIVTGNSGDQVAYNVTSSDGCILDPIIIIN